MKGLNLSLFFTILLTGFNWSCQKVDEIADGSEKCRLLQEYILDPNGIKIPTKLYYYLEDGSLNGMVSQYGKNDVNSTREYEYASGRPIKRIDYLGERSKGIIGSQTEFYYENNLIYKETEETMLRGDSVFKRLIIIRDFKYAKGELTEIKAYQAAYADSNMGEYNDSDLVLINHTSLSWNDQNLSLEKSEEWNAHAYDGSFIQKSFNQSTFKYEAMRNPNAESQMEKKFKGSPWLEYNLLEESNMSRNSTQYSYEYNAYGLPSIIEKRSLFRGEVKFIDQRKLVYLCLN